MQKNSKIYIAGHRGLVGSAIVKSLKKKGYTNLIYKTHNYFKVLIEERIINTQINEQLLNVFK